MSQKWSNDWEGDGEWEDSSPKQKRRKPNRGRGGKRFNQRDDQWGNFSTGQDLQEGRQLRSQVQDLLSWVNSDPPSHGPSSTAYPRCSTHGYNQGQGSDYNQGYNTNYNQGYGTNFNQGYSSDYSQGYSNQGYGQWGQGYQQGASWSGSNYNSSFNDSKPSLLGQPPPPPPPLPPPEERPPQRNDRYFRGEPSNKPSKKTLRGVRGGKKVKAKRAFQQYKQSLLPPGLPQDPEERREEVLKRIAAFSDFIRESDSNNAIMAIEKGLVLSRIGLRVYYDHDVVHKVGKTYILTARFALNEIFVARAMGPEKKSVRSAVYKRALQALKEKTVPEILDLKDVGVEMLQADALSYFQLGETYDDPNAIAQERLEMMERGELEVSEEALSMIKSSDREDMKVEEDLASFMSYLKAVMPFPKDSMVYFLDINAPRHQLEPRCVVKVVTGDSSSLSGETFKCEFHVTNVYIASGTGSTKVAAQADTYDNAYKILTTYTVEEVVAMGRAPRPEDLNVKSVEVWHKSKLKNADTNVWRLKLHRLDPIEIAKEWYQAVIIETHNWCQNRKKHAFCILLMTANWNGMLLEWNTKRLEEDENVFRCEMYLQRYKIGEAISPDKQAIRNLAAADGLFKMYETLPVIKVKSSFKAPEMEITPDQVKDRGVELKIESGDTGDDDFITTMPVTETPAMPPEQAEEERYVEEHEKEEEGHEEEEEVHEEINAPRDRLIYQTTEDHQSDPEAEASTDVSAAAPNTKDEFVASIPGRFRINKWHKKAIEEIFENYVNTDSLQEIRFLSGFRPGEIEQVKVQARKYGLRISKDKTKEVYFKVLQRRMPDELLAALVRIGDTSGRFTLVSKSEVPRHKDIERILWLAANTL